MKTSDSAKQTAKELREGKVILCPTDTIWGLSCDATNEAAIKKIYSIKKRQEDKSFIVLVNSNRMVNQIFKEIPAVAWDLFDLSEATTLILDDAGFVAPNVISEDGSLGVRFVKSGECAKILNAFQKPIVSTSPNVSGLPSPLSYNEIDENIKTKVDFIYPENHTSEVINKPSKIIKIGKNGEVRIIRE